ncbi:hypothetical protein MKUB_07860 [Mycobacterium kubicae]|uniref:Uncharacterized protein n=1 Tax=Mycobacterium kubicae TaxID=120959 RepID=A0ABQ1BI52_9MYCO|nr:hypothetical protein MKUB_07860 [Mycobacterium kubicae]
MVGAAAGGETVAEVEQDASAKHATDSTIARLYLDTDIPFSTLTSVPPAKPCGASSVKAFGADGESWFAVLSSASTDSDGMQLRRHARVRRGLLGVCAFFPAERNGRGGHRTDRYG